MKHENRDGSTGHDWRDPVTNLTAKTALAKVGVTLGNVNSDDHGESLKTRNELRRGLNLIQDSARKAIENGDDAGSVRLIDEAEAVAELVQRVQRRIDANEQVQHGADRTSGIKAMRTPQDFKAHYSKQSDGGEEFTLVDWFRGVANLKTTTAVRNALSVGTNTAGGFSVPSLVMPDILGALAPVSSLVQAGMGIAALDQGSKNYTTAVVNTIPTAAWRLEGGSVATSDPAFRGVVATPQSLAFQFKVSRELLADSPNMQQALLIVIAQAFAKEMDRAGLRGTGTAPEPRGILNTSGIQTVTNGANGTALAGYANLFSAVQAILQADAPMPTAAIMSPRSQVKLGGLLDTTNQPLNVPPMLNPMKLIATSQIPNNLTVGTSTDCSELFVGDFTQIVMMLRENLSVQLLTELHAGTGEIGFIAHARVDFATLYPAAFALVTGVRA